MKSLFEQMGGTYRKEGDYYIPNLELHQARQKIRSDKEKSAIHRVQNTYGKAYNSMAMFDAKRETANLLGEEAESRSIRERLWQKEQQVRQERQQQQPKKKSRDSWER